MLSISADGILACPQCGAETTHVDDAYLDGRPRDDGDHEPVHVDRKGRVSTGQPFPTEFEGGRRHAFTLVGWCEQCGGRFGIVWRQHKGATIVSVLNSAWVGNAMPPLTPNPNDSDHES